MKALLLGSIIFVFGLFSECQAQNFKGRLPNYNPYVGTWAGSNGQDSLVIKLKKEKFYFESLNMYLNRLIGKYYHYRNGKLISNNFETQKNTLLHGTLSNLSTGESYLDFTFIDLNKNKKGHLLLIFINDSQDTVRWKLLNKERIFVAEQKPKDWTEFSVPKRMILYKIR